jgi:hypothetical protein
MAGAREVDRPWGRTTQARIHLEAVPARELQPLSDYVWLHLDLKYDLKYLNSATDIANKRRRLPGASFRLLKRIALLGTNPRAALSRTMERFQSPTGKMSLVL